VVKPESIEAKFYTEKSAQVARCLQTFGALRQTGA